MGDNARSIDARQPSRLEIRHRHFACGDLRLNISISAGFTIFMSPGPRLGFLIAT
jgi:hypothetical protein